MCTVGTSHAELRYHRKSLRKGYTPCSTEAEGGRPHTKPTDREPWGIKLIITKANTCSVIFSCNAITKCLMGPKKGKNSAVDEALHLLS